MVRLSNRSQRFLLLCQKKKYIYTCKGKRRLPSASIRHAALPQPARRFGKHGASNAGVFVQESITVPDHVSCLVPGAR